MEFFGRVSMRLVVDSGSGSRRIEKPSSTEVATNG